MKTVSERLQLRRRASQTVVPVTIGMPEDVVEDLKEIAALKGYTRYEALVRTYVGHGMRLDLERLNGAPVQRLAESLKKRGLSHEAIALVLAESGLGAPIAAEEGIPQFTSAEAG